MSRVTIPRLPDGSVDRVEWLRLRHSLPCVGASSAGCFYGVHPFRSLGDLAAEKLGPPPTDDVNTAAQSRGHYLEPAIRNWYSDKIGVPIVEPDVMYVNGAIAATLDGEFVGSDTDVIECKTTREDWSYGIPAFVRCQAVAQAVAKPTIERVHVAYLDCTMRFQVEIVEPLPQEKSDLAARADAFMAYVGMGMVPPDVTLGYDNVLRWHPTVEPEACVDLDDAGLDTLRAWDEARVQRLAAEKEEKAHRDAVAWLFSDAALAKFDGDVVATWKNQKDGKRVLRPTGLLWTTQELSVEAFG